MVVPRASGVSSHRTRTSGPSSRDGRLGDVPRSNWSVLDAAPDATVVVDTTGRIVYANPRTADVLGWSPSELVGQTVDVLLPAELRSRHTGHMAGFLKSPRARMMGAGLDLGALH